MRLRVVLAAEAFWLLCGCRCCATAMKSNTSASELHFRSHLGSNFEHSSTTDHIKGALSRYLHACKHSMLYVRDIPDMHDIHHCM